MDHKDASNLTEPSVENILSTISDYVDSDRAKIALNNMPQINSNDVIKDVAKVYENTLAQDAKSMQEFHNTNNLAITSFASQLNNPDNSEEVKLELINSVNKCVQHAYDKDSEQKEFNSREADKTRNVVITIVSWTFSLVIAFVLGKTLKKTKN